MGKQCVPAPTSLLKHQSKEKWEEIRTKRTQIVATYREVLTPPAKEVEIRRRCKQHTHLARLRTRNFFSRVAQGHTLQQFFVRAISKRNSLLGRIPCSARYSILPHLHRARWLPFTAALLKLDSHCYSAVWPICRTISSHKLSAECSDWSEQWSYLKGGQCWIDLRWPTLLLSIHRRQVKDWTWECWHHHCFRWSEGIYHSNGESSATPAYLHRETDSEKSKQQKIKSRLRCCAWFSFTKTKDAVWTQIYTVSSKGKLIKPSEKNLQLDKIVWSSVWEGQKRISRCIVMTELFMNWVSNFVLRGWNCIERISHMTILKMPWIGNEKQSFSRRWSEILSRNRRIEKDVLCRSGKSKTTENWWTFYSRGR